MPTFGFLIDNRRCIGCHACTVACKSEHQVPLGVDRTWVKYVEKGVFPNNRRYFSVMRCNHCDWAPCVTICPVTALYRRSDGVVDFNSDRCIGCKACLQACPYDALYIDPERGTAAKCNFCTHRLEANMEPACVTVCPEQAIVAGDLDDPASRISQLLAQHPVQVRKPEKETRPKLFYIQADEASLVPTQSSANDQFMWARSGLANESPEKGSIGSHSSPAGQPGRMELPVLAREPKARRVYDVPARKPAWGWEVAAYTWTKSLAAGSFLVIAFMRFMGDAESAAATGVRMAITGLLFLMLTALLLIKDLKQPARFLYVLLRPQWKSWLVRGAYILTAYGGLMSAWLACELAGARDWADALLAPGVLLAVLSAVYTGFLFGQAKGRDFWQNPLLSVHLLTQALVAGGCLWLVMMPHDKLEVAMLPYHFLTVCMVFSLLSITLELFATPPTADARQALDWIIGKPMGWWFWAGGIGVGHVVPLALLVGGLPEPVLVVPLALVGLYIIERLWVLAPQQIPLS
jgi:Fe-S-cluster-containing dehydrogenase component/formate-dependent nitrite reductase membrane component NrfD